MGRIVFCVALLAACAAGARAAESLDLIRDELVIAPGQTAALEFGTLPQRDTTILLEVRARVHLSKPAGSMFFLKLRLNGREVNAAPSRKFTRLVNKPLISPVAANTPASWFGPGGWRLIYAPDFEIGTRVKFYADDPYRLVIDITDLTNPAAENRLEITNSAKPGKWTAPEGNLVLRKLTIRTREGASPAMAGAAQVGPFINRGEPAAGPAAYRGEVLPGGGLALVVGSRRWEFSTAISYPNAGFNKLVPLGQPDNKGQPGWTPKIQTTIDGGIVAVEAADYRLRREVRFTPRKIEVSDTLTNLSTSKPLGLMVRHEVNLAGCPDAPVRLAGNPDPAVDDYYSPANPSVHISLADQGLGIICEDDVFRNQARLFVSSEPAAAGIRTDMLRLAPGESYTLRWSIYPVAGPDYFDFINLVRQDWAANFTVEGPWTFFSPDSILALPVDTIREKFTRLGIRYAIYCGGWVDPNKDRKRIGFGTGVLDEYWADFRRRLREAAAKIHEACPNVKVLVYYDTQRDTALERHEQFRDSWLTDPRGLCGSTQWSGQYSLTWSMLATLDNSFGKAMLDAADRYLDEMKIDGIYWDEMEHVGYGFPLLTHNAGDGHSGLIDPKTLTISGEVGITTLLGEKHRLAVIDRVRRKGGFVMGNGPCYTRGLLASGAQRMVEIQHNDYWCYEGNLGTPLGYMSSRPEFANVIRGLKMACLPVGTRYDYAHEISRYLFPFTPIELHHGYLLGRERIVAVHSGNYGWSSQRALVQVHRFDTHGILAADDFVTTVASEARTKVELAEGEAVVLESLPITLEHPAQVRHVRYGPREVWFEITSSGPADLCIGNGTFKVVPGHRYRIEADGKVAQALAHDGALRISLPALQAGKVRVSRE